MKQDKSWQACFINIPRASIVLNSQLNTLPSLDNLRRWSANKDGLCTQKHATLCHILDGCPWVRGTENSFLIEKIAILGVITLPFWLLQRLYKNGLQKLTLKLSQRKLSNFAPLQSDFILPGLEEKTGQLPGNR